MKIFSFLKIKIRKKTASSKPGHIFFYNLNLSPCYFAVRWFVKIINLIKEGKRISFLNYKKINIISQDRIE